MNKKRSGPQLAGLPSDLRPPAEGLKQDAQGIWHARTHIQNETVSYPTGGNAECYVVEENSFWFRHRAEVILAALTNFPAAGTIYDVGGGNGYVARFLLNAGFEAALLEPGMIGARNAKLRGISTVIHATFKEARFTPNSLPAIGLFDVLEHVKEDVDFLNQIYDALTPGARFYVTVPAFNWLWSHDDLNAGHYRRYTTARIVTDLQTVGFKALYHSYFFSLLPLPIFAVRTLPSLFGRIKFSANAHGNLHHPRFSGLVDKVLNAESNQIRNGSKIPFGSSCLVVAEKPKQP